MVGHRHTDCTIHRASRAARSALRRALRQKIGLFLIVALKATRSRGSMIAGSNSVARSAGHIFRSCH